MCKHSKGKTDIALLRLFMRCSLWREHLDGTVSVWGEKVFSLVCWSWGFVALGNGTVSVLYPQKQKVLSFPQPLLPKMSYLKEKQNRKGTNLFSGSSQGAWRSMNYLSSEILYYFCMKESPIIKSECFFFLHVNSWEIRLDWLLDSFLLGDWAPQGSCCSS